MRHPASRGALRHDRASRSGRAPRGDRRPRGGIRRDPQRLGRGGVWPVRSTIGRSRVPPAIFALAILRRAWVVSEDGCMPPSGSGSAPLKDAAVTQIERRGTGAGLPAPVRFVWFRAAPGASSIIIALPIAAGRLRRVPPDQILDPRCYGSIPSLRDAKSRPDPVPGNLHMRIALADI